MSKRTPEPCDKSERSLAKAKDFDIWLEDHGRIVLGGHFDYEGSSSQGLSYLIDIDFLKRFMQVFNVEFLRQVNGRSCWVTHVFDRILKIEPLHKKDGQLFNIKEWSESRAALAQAEGKAVS